MSNLLEHFEREKMSYCVFIYDHLNSITFYKSAQTTGSQIERNCCKITDGKTHSLTQINTPKWHRIYSEETHLDPGEIAKK